MMHYHPNMENVLALIPHLRAIALVLAATAALPASGPGLAAPAQDGIPTPAAPARAATRPVSPPEVMRVAPPPVMIETIRSSDEQPPSAMFRVRVTGAGQEIWSGDMSLEGYQGAELRMTLQQGDGVCGARGEMRSGRRQTGLTLTIRSGGRRDGEPFEIVSEWTRQSPDCALPGTRTSGIGTTVAIAPGANKVIEADGGLRIELTRRR